jgi:hypothetical protein
MANHVTKQAPPITADQAEYLIAIAARAPSVHNTQPWRFRVDGTAVELYADLSRKLRTDQGGREMLISCGAAVFGLRLAARSLGYQPAVEILPDPASRRLLARVRLSAGEPMTAQESELLDAIPHRHTHRDAFAPGPLPDGLLRGLKQDARAEGARLAIVDSDASYEVLADIVATVADQDRGDPAAEEEIWRWSRSEGDPSRDGVPAHAFGSGGDPEPGMLASRDFDLGRGLGRLAGPGTVPAVTAVLVTPSDTRADWLVVGQALQRLLAHAASAWVFANLSSQPLQSAAARRVVKDRLGIEGVPQMIMQLSPARSTRATARRPPADLMEP